MSGNEWLHGRAVRHGLPLLLALAAVALFATVLQLQQASAPQAGAEPPDSTLPATTPGTAATTATPAVTPTPTPRWPVTLAAVGDIMLARGVADALSEADPAGPFEHVRGLLAATDLTIGNLESSIGTGGSPEPKGYTFQSPPLAARALDAAGFDVVALANNHILDYGREGLAETLELLNAAGVGAVGAGQDDSSAWAPLTREAGGARVAFLSLVEVPDEAGYSMRAWAAGEDRPGVAWVDDGRMVEAVSAAAADADIVVVFMHFGIEFAPEPTDRQRRLARSAIDAGADLVVGSHPHVLQQVEEYGDGLIAYSLGNFVFDGFEGPSNDTAILVVTFNADGTFAWRLHAVAIGWDGLPRLVD